MNWIIPSEIKPPNRLDYSCTADFNLDWDVWASLQNASSNYPGDYPTTADYQAAMINYAFYLTQNNYLLKSAPVGWNWALAGLAAAEKCFFYLDQIPKRQGDPNAPSVLAYWKAGGK